MSLSTTFSHVIFGLPLPLLPSTVISILFFTQSFPSFLNTCPIHLSLLRLITSLIFSMPILSLSSAFVFFSLSDTPHIHLTILISALSSFVSCSAFIAHVSLPYIIELRTHAPYTFPFNLNAVFPLFLLFRGLTWGHETIKIMGTQYYEIGESVDLTREGWGWRKLIISLQFSKKLVTENLWFSKYMTYKLYSHN